jgi:putative tryptophan/tyrosine transport system substrate-binding protein
MRRRDFIVVVGSAAAWPLIASAQSAMPVIGFLNGGSPRAYQHLVAALHEGLKEVGYVDRQNVVIEYRWAEDRYNQLPALVADLIRRPVNVIAAMSTPAALAAEASKTAIPIIFSTGGDPVRLGLVASLNRPGRNITGVTQLATELAPKRLGLLRDLLPSATKFGLLVDPADPRTKILVRDIQDASRALGLQIHVLNTSTETEIGSAFARLAELRVGAVFVGTGELFNGRPEQVVALAARQGLPAVYPNREFAVVGGLMSYGTSRTDAWRQVGLYVGRVLKGEKPADLPVLQSNKFELVINLKTAKALGLTVPAAVFSIADEVIE